MVLTEIAPVGFRAASESETVEVGRQVHSDIAPEPSPDP